LNSVVEIAEALSSLLYRPLILMIIGAFPQLTNVPGAVY
jgi:hypothetical protein